MTWNTIHKLLKEFGENKIPQRGLFLSLLLKELKIANPSIAEIGVFDGMCSAILRYFFPTAHLYLIDPWEINQTYSQSDGPITAKDTIMKSAYRSVKDFFDEDPYATILKKTSKEAAPLTPNSLDLVFIDGNHDYEFVKEDIETWLPKVRPGGIVAGHDYDPKGKNFPGVKKAVDELLGEQCLLGCDFVWYYIKP